jgi:hypothetical protein
MDIFIGVDIFILPFLGCGFKPHFYKVALANQEPILRSRFTTPAM